MLAKTKIDHQSDFYWTATPLLLLGFQFIFYTSAQHRDLSYVIFCNPPGGIGCDCAQTRIGDIVTFDCGSLQYTINQSDNYWLEHKQQK